MQKYVIQGGSSLKGSTKVSGAKNVALKALVAACLTDETVIIKNIPLISDVKIMLEIIREIGGEVVVKDHVAEVTVKNLNTSEIPLDRAAAIRASSMLISPLLIRKKEALVPNPGGCRLGARPIDRTIDGLREMGAKISYDRNDGFFHAQADELHGVTYEFEKNTHTGTETLIIAGAMASGKTVLRNASEEPEVDELIELINSMGAKIKRLPGRIIEIEGVKNLHGAEFTIKPDRNEIVTIACAAILTGGDVFVEGATKDALDAFLVKLDEAGGGFEIKENGIRFFATGGLKATDVTTAPAPGFMTDWQGPWVVMMTAAEGETVVHETVFENRFGYIKELKKMGAKIDLFNPPVEDPKEFYNFNIKDDDPSFFHAVRVHGPSSLHNGVVQVTDIRAGATLVLAALAASGTSTILGIEILERGYEALEERLSNLGAKIKKTDL